MEKGQNMVGRGALGRMELYGGATGGHWGKESGQMGVTETGGVRDYAPQV